MRHVFLDEQLGIVGIPEVSLKASLKVYGTTVLLPGGCEHLYTTSQEIHLHLGQMSEMGRRGFVSSLKTILCEGGSIAHFSLKGKHGGLLVSYCKDDDGTPVFHLSPVRPERDSH